MEVLAGSIFTNLPSLIFSKTGKFSEYTVTSDAAPTQTSGFYFDDSGNTQSAQVQVPVPSGTVISGADSLFARSHI